jgi:hypothetical protein
VAEEMDWSLSKMMRIEKGEVTISVSDLRALLSYLGVDDEAEVGQLLDNTRSARAERRAGDAALRRHLTLATQQLIQFEAEADSIRFFSMVLVPGILQTKDYATAVFAQTTGDLSAEAIRARIQTRLRRADQVVYRPDPPEFLIALDESALLRSVGGPRVMAEQLRGLLRIIDETTVSIRIFPLRAAAFVDLLGSFQILKLPAGGGEFLYRETNGVDEIVDTPAMIDRYRKSFEQLWGQTLTVGESKEMIEAQAMRWLGSH